MINHTTLRGPYSELPIHAEPIGEEFPAGWRKGITLLYCFEGRYTLQLGRKNYLLDSGGLAVVNQYQVFSLLAADGLGVSLELDPLFFARYDPAFPSLRFPVSPAPTQDVLNVKQSLAALLEQLLGLKGDDGLSALENCVHLARSLIPLSIEGTAGERQDIGGQKQQRLGRILTYLEEHYHRRVTLQELAEREYVSLQYLSKYIKENLGAGFSEYLSSMRLNKSIGELSSTRVPISEIAETYGFSSAKAYNRTFRAAYGLSPTEYRKQVPKGAVSDPPSTFSALQKTGNSFRKAVEAFAREQRGDKGSRKVEYTEVSADLEKRATLLVTFRKTLYFQFVSDLLNAKWQSDLAAVQQEAKFRYIKFRGVFTRGMYFFDQERDEINWFNIDNILDFFLSNNLKPFIELAFSPEEYSFQSWMQLIDRFLAHCMERYGFDELITWNFEFSSEDKCYGSAIKLYTRALEKLNKLYRQLRLGILFLPADDFEKQYYLVNFQDKNLTFMSVQFSRSLYNRKEAHFKELFYNISQNMGLELYVIETHPPGVLNDSCNRAHQLARLFLENVNVDLEVPFLDYFSHAELFSGGAGLLTYNSLKKPVYNAYLLMGRMYGYVVERGRGWLITRRNNLYKILALHPGIPQLEENEPEGQTAYEAYQAATSRMEMHYRFFLRLPAGTYELRRYTLNRESGSVYDAWLEMGRPKTMSVDDMEYLRSREKMHLSLRTVAAEGELRLDACLRGDEIQYIELKRIGGD